MITLPQTRRLHNIFSFFTSENKKKQRENHTAPGEAFVIILHVIEEKQFETIAMETKPKTKTE